MVCASRPAARLLRTAAPFELQGWYFGTTRPIVRLVVDLIIRVVLYTCLWQCTYTVVHYLQYYSTVPTTKTKRTQREKGDNPSKRGSSLDQTQSSEFAGQKEEGENHPGDDHGA